MFGEIGGTPDARVIAGDASARASFRGIRFPRLTSPKRCKFSNEMEHCSVLILVKCSVLILVKPTQMLFT